MIIEWKESLATGHEVIDDQHKELIKRISSLLTACTQGRGKDEVGNLLKFMADYVRFHFSAEEELQLQYSYPEFPAHKAEHEEFIGRLHELESKFFKDGATLSLVIQTNHSLMDWLRNHIGFTDKRLATFLRSARAA